MFGATLWNRYQSNSFAYYDLQRQDYAVGGIRNKVNRNIQETFNYMSNPENNKYWLSGVTKIKKNTPGKIKVGTVFEFQRKVAGRIVEGTIKIINRRRGFKGNPIKLHLIMIRNHGWWIPVAITLLEFPMFDRFVRNLAAERRKR